MMLWKSTKLERVMNLGVLDACEARAVLKGREPLAGGGA